MIPRKRRQDSCDDQESTPKRLSAPPSRPTPPCDPPVAPVEPSRITPEPSPPEPEDLRTPATISAPSDPVNKTCAADYPIPDGDPAPVGPDVVLTQGAATVPFRIQSVTSLTPSKLDYIAGKQLENEAAIITALNTDAAAVQALLRVNSTDAQALVDAWAAAIVEATELADTLALSQLACLWSNVETVVSCEVERPLDGDAVDAVDVNPITISAGTFTSPNSQGEANEKARNEALSQLVCRYQNDAVTLQCTDDGKADLDPGQPDVANGGSLGTEGPGANVQIYPETPGRYRVNEVTISAGAITSAYSKADANARALEDATDLLDCFYVNAAGSVSCPGSGTTVGDWSTNTPGNIVNFPAGIAGSEISWADALAQAQARASSLLNCVICSAAVTVDCTDIYPPGSTFYSVLVGGDVPYEASPDNSPTFTVSLDACAIILPDTASQAEADQAAYDLAISQLECVLCTLDTEPGRCDATTSDVRDPFNDEARSLDRTLGVTEIICSSSVGGLRSDFDGQGLTPDPDVGAESACTFGNLPVIVTCDEIDDTAPFEEALADGYTLVNLSEWFSLPSPYTFWEAGSGGWVQIEANSFTGVNLEQANDAALEAARATLGCAFQSEATAVCPDSDIPYGETRPQNSFGVAFNPSPLPPLFGGPVGVTSLGGTPAQYTLDLPVNPTSGDRFYINNIPIFLVSPADLQQLEEEGLLPPPEESPIIINPGATLEDTYANLAAGLSAHPAVGSAVVNDSGELVLTAASGSSLSIGGSLTTLDPPTNTATGVSSESQEDADRIAREVARSGLRCPYTNYPVSAPLNPCPNGTELVGASTGGVGAGAFISEGGSTTDADLQAEASITSSVECRANISGKINVAGGSVSGGGAYVGNVCEFDPACEDVIFPGAKVDFLPLDYDIESSACFHLKLECDTVNEKLIAVIEERGPEEGVPENSETAIYIDLGCYDPETRVVKQIAQGHLVFNHCPDDAAEANLNPHPWKVVAEIGEDGEPSGTYNILPGFASHVVFDVNTGDTTLADNVVDYAGGAAPQGSGDHIIAKFDLTAQQVLANGTTSNKQLGGGVTIVNDTWPAAEEVGFWKVPIAKINTDGSVRQILFGNPIYSAQTAMLDGFDYPWKVTPVYDANGATGSYKVAAGTVSHIVYDIDTGDPVHTNDVIQYAGVTQAFTPGDVIYVEISLTGDQEMTVSRTLNKQIVGPLVLTASGTWPPADTANKIFVPIAEITGVGVVRQIQAGDILISAQEMAPGDTFIVELYDTDIYTVGGSPSGVSPGGSGGCGCAVEADAFLSYTFYVLHGVWYESQPTNWPDPFNGNTYYFSYVLPTIGGPAPPP